MDPSFEARLQALRPRLHRYCARMTGSAVDGEDVVQTALLKALQARDQVTGNPEAWLFRIAHNASLDHLRSRTRVALPLPETLEADPGPDPGALFFGFRTFLRLPELQRCAVILKDVLGHSVEDIAAIAECSPAASKSALQRGRAALRQMSQEAMPPLSNEDRTRIEAFVQHFRVGDFDRVRAMLAEDVRLDLVNRLRLDGKDRVTPYFTRYAEATHWRFAPGIWDGRPAMLVYDGAASEPSHVVLLDWQDRAITLIRDYLFAPYVMEGTDWTPLPCNKADLTCE